ncbi:melanoma-associated antigen D4 [Calliphora vicina]|uniref:melanoma-associated antigen D4 n=1 Tax=Calliphora vicina TaxID=7373 RepID=UPI00325C184F
MESFSIDEISNYTNSIITFVINGASTKLPLKEKDMISTINIKGKLFYMALSHAKTALKETYGLMLADVPDSKSGKAYICHSEEPGLSLLLFDEDQQRHITLLFVILSYLFMRGSDTPHKTKTTEEDLKTFLDGLRIKFDEYHPYFGQNLKKLITETFVKQLYLKREKDVSELDSETKFNYYWGFRAHSEFDKKLLLDATAKILKKPPTFFVAKHQELYGNEDVEMSSSTN